MRYYLGTTGMHLATLFYIWFTFDSQG